MSNHVAIIGCGYTPIRVATPEASYRELTFEAAQRAYADAGISHEEVQSAVCCEEDFIEGISITDEYTPDQLGVVLRSVETVGGDGLHGLGIAAMQIQTGALDIVVVEAHSKASNVLTFDHITEFALDPIWNRPLGFHPEFIAGMEMNRFLHEAKLSVEDCDRIAAKNRTNALSNPIAAYPARMTSEDIAHSPHTCAPLREAHEARRADGAVVLVLASEERAKGAERPVWIRGTGWANDSPTLESRPWGKDGATEAAARIAYEEAGIRDPSREIDLFEVDDLYAHREAMALAALGVKNGAAGVNPSGGSLGMGHTLDAIGLYRAAMCVDAIRSGRSKVALAQSWRGVPTTSVAMSILSVNHG
ncbi:MAG: acetyl-CoA acetyltransferase [Planctomycetota bacterium]|nr:acetyl-CoA acetyltransferase [Planctomycetota bacterium]